MQALLSVTGLNKYYPSNPVPSLAGLSFNVNKGDYIAIMGASGSGKTTLLNVLSTIDTPSSGDIVIDGVSIGSLKPSKTADFRKDKLGFIFQEYYLLDSLSIFENIAVPLTLLSIPHAEIEAAVLEIAERFGIASQLKKYPYQLSGGQKQRAAAARALVKNPSIVFADEPTGALDSASSSELLATLQKANKELQTTILMVTHDAFAASFASRLLILRDGYIMDELNKNATDSQQVFYEEIFSKISQLNVVPKT